MVPTSQRRIITIPHPSHHVPSPLWISFSSANKQIAAVGEGRMQALPPPPYLEAKTVGDKKQGFSRCVFFFLRCGSVRFYRTAPHRAAPHRTAPHRTAPHRTRRIIKKNASYRTARFQNINLHQIAPFDSHKINPVKRPWGLKIKWFATAWCGLWSFSYRIAPSDN